MPAKTGRRWRPTAKTAAHAACALPLVWLAWRGATGELGVNPIETVIRFLGLWGLRLLVVALAVTPARRLLHRAELARFRRMLGLWAFAYVCLHLLCYVVVDQFFDWAAIGHDIVKHKFITVGMAAFVLLVPLAATSTRGMMRRLGGVRWQRLHRAVYLAGVCGAVHYIWMVKADIRQPLVYAAIVAVLLGLRAAWALRDRPAAVTAR